MKSFFAILLGLFLCICPVEIVMASVSVNVNGTAYTIPQNNEKGWGTNVTSWIQAMSRYTLQPTGGSFALTSDADFGSTFGLKAPYYKSASSNIATSGVLRLNNTDRVSWRNNANSSNITFGVNTSDRLIFGGVAVPTISSSDTLTNKTFTEVGNLYTSFIKSGQQTFSLKYGSDADVFGSQDTMYVDTSANPALKWYWTENSVALWDPSVTMPVLPHTGIYPHLAVYGDIYIGDIGALGSSAMTYGIRTATGLDPDVAVTNYFSAKQQLKDSNGGATFIITPNYNGTKRDGDVRLYAFGLGSHTMSNSISFNRRTGVDTDGLTGYFNTDGHYIPGTDNTYDFGSSASKIRSLYVGTNSTLGTVASGVWNGTAVAPTYGGTGQNFSASTGLVKVASGTMSAATLVNADVNATAAIALTKLAATTVSRALVSDASGFIVPATTTATEIGYVNGVTSAIQTQITARVTRTAMTDWASETCPLSWTTNTTSTCKSRRVGGDMEIDLNVALTGVPDTATLTMTVPQSKSFNTGGMGTSTANRSVKGFCVLINAAAGTFLGPIRYTSSTAVIFSTPTSSGAGTLISVNQSNPGAWANGDSLNCHMWIPISGWSAND